MSPLINILIRTHEGREALLERALLSVEKQTYQPRKTLIHRDRSVTKFPFHYNLFCNDLKALVKDGFFFFLDSDDYLVNDRVLETLVPHLDPSTANIVPMLRGGRPKPSRPENIRKGYIGMPCMVLHHSHKDKGDITAEDCGDWTWINSVIKKIGFKYIAIPLVYADKRRWGN